MRQLRTVDLCVKTFLIRVMFFIIDKYVGSPRSKRSVVGQESWTVNYGGRNNEK